MRLFRVARPASPTWIVAKSLLQMAAFWTTFLGLIPWGIVSIERAIGLEPFGFAGQKAIAITLFAAWSTLGLTSMFTMSLLGRGTPLPLDCAPRLVVRGPYALVRNPMAIAGTMQGVAVGIGLGSWPTIAYSVAGMVGWDLLARPAEERDLEARFGAAFVAYRRAVRCWVPRLRPYVPSA